VNVRFLAIAQEELDDAVEWYNQQTAESGLAFLDEIDRAIRRIAVFPMACAEIEPDLRRCLLARFPYGMIYGLEEGTIIVVAVAHLHREPRYWIDRI
jgi:plasmid stabilization system protein ParE